MSKPVSFFGLPGFRLRIKIHQFSIKQSSSSSEMLLEPLMAESKLVVVEEFEFENLDVINIFGLSRIGTKDKT